MGAAESSAANCTPGEAVTRSSTWRYASRARSGSPYCAAGNAIRAVRTPRVSNPIGSCWRLIALRTSSAAPASTIITSAACAPISSCRIHGLSEPLSAPLPSPRSSVSDARRVACHAGSSPTNIALPRTIAIAAASTGASMVAVSSRGTPSGARLISTGRDHHAIATPVMPPSAARTRLSVSTCLTMRPRPAPIAARIASSRCRAARRASSRFATLPHAISSTSATAARRMNRRSR